MLPTDRIAYSAITERAPLKLPDGARMAVWVIVMSRNGTRASRCHAQYSRHLPAARPCPTFRTGPGTNTATGRVSHLVPV
jgi:hypothetical protein